MEVVETRCGAITEQARELAATNHDVVFACGGDGTVSDVAAGLAGTGVPVGIIPLGTTNVLAREFGIPLGALAAFNALRRATATRALRSWSTGTGTLVLGAGIGWDAQLMHAASSRWKRRLGFAGLLPLSVSLLARYDFPDLRIEGLDAEGAPVSTRATSVIASNVTRWSGSNVVFPLADPADELIEVIAIDCRTRAQLAGFWMAMTVPGGRPTKRSGIQVLPMREVRVSVASGPPAAVHVNGDAAGHTPLEIRPAGVVGVLVPQ